MKEFVMMIEEIITRQCCHIKDMKPVLGNPFKENLRDSKEPMFCIHCGSIWVLRSYIDESGNRDTKRVKLIIKSYGTERDSPIL